MKVCVMQTTVYTETLADPFVLIAIIFPVMVSRLWPPILMFCGSPTNDVAPPSLAPSMIS